MLRLVSNNPDPRPNLYDEFVFIDARHESEWHQREQSEAHDYGFLVVFGATCFLFGTLFASAVMFVLAKVWL